MATDPGRHRAVPVATLHFLGMVLTVSLPAASTLALGLLDIGRRQMWNDEYATWHASTLPFKDLNRLLGTVDGVLGVYYYLMHGWIALAGDSPTALRLPSTIAMAFAAMFTAMLGRHLFGGVVGLGAGMLFALLPAVSRYAQEARPYAFAICAAAAASLFLLRATMIPSRRRWIHYSVALALAGAAHMVTVTMLFAHGVDAWKTQHHRRDQVVRRWTAATLVAGVLLIPLISLGSSESGSIQWIKADWNAVRHLPGRLFGSDALAHLFIVVGCLAIAILWREHRREARFLGCLAALPPLFCLLTAPVLHLFLDRYLLFTLPAWTILVAAACTQIRIGTSRFLAVRLVLPAAVIAATVGLTGWLGLADQRTVRQHTMPAEPDLQAVAAELRARMAPGDAIAYGGYFRNIRRAMAYEMRPPSAPADVFLQTSAAKAGRYRALECQRPDECLGKTRRIWLVTTQPSAHLYDEMPDANAELLQQEFRPILTLRPANIRVVLLLRHT